MSTHTQLALPVLFLSHGGGPAHVLDFRGSPFSSLDRNSPSASFMRGLPKVVDAHSASEIKCIVVVSAHWEESTFTVDYQTGETKLIYDYYGFPKESYAPLLTYPVKTDLSVADRILGLLHAAGLPCEKMSRGFDHGTFIPLKVAYPDANIPVVQVSLKSNLNMAEHVRLGEVLQPLRKEGVLIIASGQITHNLSAMRSSSPGDNRDATRTEEFMEYISNLLSESSVDNYSASKQKFLQIPAAAPHFAWAHPREEHFVPLAVAFGAAFGGEEAAATKALRLYREVVMGSMGVDSYIFTSL